MNNIFDTSSGTALRALVGMWAIGFLISGCGKDTAKQEVPTPTANQAESVASNDLVTLTEKQAAELNIHVSRAVSSQYSYIINAPGEVQAAPGNISVVSAPVNGRVVTIYAHEGEGVSEGQPLLDLESLEFANLVADYVQANAEEMYQNQQMERLNKLVEEGISPKSVQERVQMDYTRARASEQAALARLRALGVAEEQIDGWRSGRESKPLLQLKSAINGTIDEHLINLGEAVNAYDRLLTVVNKSKVLIRGYVSPDDAAFLRPGDSLSVFPQKNREIHFDAAVTTINPALDQKNKAVVVNIITPTVNQMWPIPGQSVQLQIRTEAPVPAITVPLSAVTYEGNDANIFVQIDRLKYRKQKIQIRQITDTLAIVGSGLNGNELVAISNVFGLKALSRMSEFAE